GHAKTLSRIAVEDRRVPAAVDDGAGRLDAEVSVLVGRVAGDRGPRGAGRLDVNAVVILARLARIQRLTEAVTPHGVVGDDRALSVVVDDQDAGALVGDHRVGKPLILVEAAATADVDADTVAGHVVRPHHVAVRAGALDRHALLEVADDR